VQADSPVRPVRGDPGQPLPGLGGDPPGGLQQCGQVIDRAAEPASPTARSGIAAARRRQARGLALSPAQRPARVRQQPLRVRGGAPGQPGELPGDPPHHGLRLVAALRAAQPQPRRDTVRPPAR